jgi:uncharacterized membrane protein
MGQRPLKGLLLRGVFFLILGLALWVYVQPSYSRILVNVSQKLLFWTEKDENTSIKLQDNNIVYIPMGLVSKGQKTVQGMREVREIHCNSVIFFALALFSPGLGLGKRMWVLAAGLLLLFFTQVLTVFVQVKFFYALQLGEYSRIHYGPWERNIYAFLKQFSELIGRYAFPFAIWMLLTYKETLEYLTGPRSEGKSPKKKK